STTAHENPGLGYAAAPTKVTDSGGMLYSWGCSIQNDSPNKDAAEEFVKWASGTEYDQLVADNFGWARVPAIQRHSTSENPDYIEATAAFGEKAMDEILRADPDNAGTTPRPVPG